MPILLVDDNSDIRESWTVLLESAGYQVRAVADARTALTLLQTGFRPSMILLDLSMPGMDGFEFRKLQLEDPQIAHIPVIVLTGLGVSDGSIDQLSAATLLKKPVGVDTLLEKIATHRLPNASKTPAD